MNILHRSGKSGFTLVEMMVVIAIIAILTGIIVTNLVGSKAKSRDARRASDLAQIQLAIEQYFDRCGQYPSTLSTNESTNCPNDSGGNKITLGNFISTIPTDPTNSGNYIYYYAVNYSSQPTDYVLHATFESSNSASAQSATTMPSWFTTMFATAPWPGYAACDKSVSYCVRPN